MQMHKERLLNGYVAVRFRPRRNPSPGVRRLGGQAFAAAVPRLVQQRRDPRRRRGPRPQQLCHHVRVPIPARHFHRRTTEGVHDIHVRAALEQSLHHILMSTHTRHYQRRKAVADPPIVHIHAFPQRVLHVAYAAGRAGHQEILGYISTHLYISILKKLKRNHTHIKD